MIFENMVNYKCGDIVTEYFSDSIQVFSTIKLTEEELGTFGLVLSLVETQLKKDGIQKKDLKSVNVLFTPYNEFSVKREETDNSYGCKVSLILYPVQLWRDKNLRADMIAIAMIEELCHHFWNIDDEIIAKEKSIEVINNVSPEISMDTYYKKL